MCACVRVNVYYYLVPERKLVMHNYPSSMHSIVRSTHSTAYCMYIIYNHIL